MSLIKNDIPILEYDTNSNASKSRTNGARNGDVYGKE